jgi:signal transduction histidine kinase
MADSVAALQRVLHYTLPHELRTPLAGILGFADLMLLDAETLQPSEIAEMAHIIRQSGQRLQRLIENYLLYAQIELMREDASKLQALRSARFGGASAVVHQIAGDVAAEYERSADLQLFLDECDPLLAISAVDWEKIVEEVVDNAFKFSKRGAPVLIGAGMGEGGYLLSVQDHGRGMTEEQVKLIGACVQFDRKIYEQQGLGLGLAIARSLVELYAGSLHVQSEQGAGARVFIRLPLPPDEPTA